MSTLEKLKLKKIHKTAKTTRKQEEKISRAKVQTTRELEKRRDPKINGLSLICRLFMR